jgi:hypothetical protein
LFYTTWRKKERKIKLINIHWLILQFIKMAEHATLVFYVVVGRIVELTIAMEPFITVRYAQPTNAPKKFLLE